MNFGIYPPKKKIQLGIIIKRVKFLQLYKCFLKANNVEICSTLVQPDTSSQCC